MKKPIGVTHPKIAEQLVDQSLRFTISPYGKDKVEWICEHGHRWFATPSNRTCNNSKCPYCSGRKVWPGENDLASTHPELAAQLVDKELSTKLTAGSNKKVEWKCEHGHKWLATPASRVRGTGCPYCQHRKLLPGVNDLATLRPDLACQLKDPSIAQSVMPNSKRKVEWLCPTCGQTWEATPNARSRTNSQNGTNCPVCAGKKVVIGVNDLATTNPRTAASCEKPEDAKRYTQFSTKVIRWRCPSCETMFPAKISDMSTGRKACPNCAQKRAHPGKTDLATIRPDIAAMLVDKSLATKLTVNSNKTVEWHCPDCGATWESKVQSRTSAPTPCPFCSNKRVQPGVNDIATTAPELARQMVDKELAKKITKGSSRLVEWECDKGHRWFAMPMNRSKTNNPTGCPYCANKVGNKTKQPITLSDLMPHVPCEMRCMLPTTASRQGQTRCNHSLS